MKKDDTLYLPTAAVNLDTGTDVLYKIIAPEYDVCDALESTVELTWDSVPEDTRLVMRAMEEDLGEMHGSPLYFPLLREGHTLTYTLLNDGGINVDGVLEETEEPDFRVFWRPTSPHPDGYTYGGLHSDNQFVYAAVEVTGDNTRDEEDWGALFVMVNEELQEFRVSCDETKWGTIGFQYTSSVLYEHRIYEFKIPLAELNACIGEDLHYGFGAYGTFAVFNAGIVLEESSDNNTIELCTLTNNDWGIYLLNSANNSIKENEISENGHGIWFDVSDNNTVERNMLENNYALAPSGVWLDSDSDYNEIHGNCFYYNGFELLQAHDDGIYNNITGNFWQPPPGPPDDTYLINGSAENRDYNPLKYCPMCPQVPTVTPIGLVALVGLLSAIAAISISIRIRKRR